MAHFYGTIEGNRGQATRCGSKSSGMTSYAASWAGAVRTVAYEKDGVDMARVELTTWKGAGGYRLLYDGPISGKDDK